MGLLDTIIGQVVGQMSGGLVPGGRPTGGLPGGRSGLGGYAPIVMALLALLGSRNQSGGMGGGGGSALNDILARMGQGAPAGDDGRAGPQVGSGSGSFMDSIGGMLGGGSTAGVGAGAAGGLDGLIDRFRHAGMGDSVDSWIGTGANRAISPADLGRALGPDILSQLSGATGSDPHVLLGDLAHALPQVIDGLTPAGTVPGAHERSSWL